MIRRYPQFGAIAELDSDDLLLALVEPRRDFPCVEESILVSGHDMNGKLSINNLLDAMRETAYRVKYSRPFCQALILDYLHTGSVTHGIRTIFESFDASDIQQY